MASWRLGRIFIRTSHAKRPSERFGTWCLDRRATIDQAELIEALCSPLRRCGTARESAESHCEWDLEIPTFHPIFFLLLCIVIMMIFFGSTFFWLYFFLSFSLSHFPRRNWARFPSTWPPKKLEPVASIGDTVTGRPLAAFLFPLVISARAPPPPKKKKKREKNPYAIENGEKFVSIALRSLRISATRITRLAWLGEVDWFMGFINYSVKSSDFSLGWERLVNPKRSAVCAHCLASCVGKQNQKLVASFVMWFTRRGRQGPSLSSLTRKRKETNCSDCCSRPLPAAPPTFPVGGLPFTFPFFFRFGCVFEAHLELAYFGLKEKETNKLLHQFRVSFSSTFLISCWFRHINEAFFS